MNHNKSMRIFLISLMILVVSGVIIIAVVGARAQKREKQQEQEQAYQKKELQNTPSEQEPEKKLAPIKQNASDDQAGTGQSSGQKLQQTDSAIPAYQYELRAVEGYLAVYKYHTDQLFMHTGIPCSALTDRQKQDLESGKYFVSEQELYGYLESCTS